MIRRVPAPSIFAPILFRKLARSTTSGSCAAPFDDGDALRQHRGHHDVVRSEDSGTEFAAQVDDCAVEFRRENFHVAAFHANRCAERFEAFQMQIDRTVADDAAARQRNGGFFASAEQRSDHANRCAHFAHDIVGRDRFDLLRRHADCAAGALHLRAEMRSGFAACNACRSGREHDAKCTVPA